MTKDIITDELLSEINALYWDLACTGDRLDMIADKNCHAIKEAEKEGQLVLMVVANGTSMYLSHARHLIDAALSVIARIQPYTGAHFNELLEEENDNE